MEFVLFCQYGEISGALEREKNEPREGIEPSTSLKICELLYLL